MLIMELDNFLTDLKQTKDWLQRVEARVIQIENTKPKDYGTTIVSLQQDILKIFQALKAYDSVFTSYGDQLRSLKAGLDTILAQQPKQTQPKYKIWPF